MAHRPRTVADLMQEHDGLQTVRLGPVRFRLNPTSYSETAERVISAVQTSGGFGRYNYGPKPVRWEISGSTGLAGVFGPGGIEELRQFEPRPGQPDRLWAFEFPGEFRGKRYVRINEFSVTRDAGSQYFSSFKLVCEEYPPALAGPTSTALKVPGSVVSVPLPVSG